MLTEAEKRKEIIMNLIKQDFQIINLFARLDAAGFNGVDFPGITYEIFDLMGIPEKFRTNTLLEQYDEWATHLKDDSNGYDQHVEMVFKELRKLREFSYV